MEGDSTMSQVTVRRADSSSAASQSITDSLNTITNSIRSRAFQLSQTSGATNNSDATRNWIQAERDLFSVPDSQLTENAQQYQMNVSAAGYDASSLEVIASSNSIVVRSSGNRASTNSSGQTVYSDMDSRMLYRRFDLSSSIDASQVTASLDNGMLTISARKSASKSSAASA